MLHRFERPQSIAEAARLLASGSWAVLAGGTDLYPAHVGRRIAAPLLDITAIAGLRGIRRDERGWTIGATTTWTDVVRADLPPLFDALKAAAREVGVGRDAGQARLERRQALGDRRAAADGDAGFDDRAIGIDVDDDSDRADRDREVATAAELGERRSRPRGARRDSHRDDELVGGTRRATAAEHEFVEGQLALAALALQDDAGAEREQHRGAVSRRRGVAQVAGDGACVLDLHAADLAPLTPIDDLRGSAAYRRDATATLVRRALRDVGSP